MKPLAFNLKDAKKVSGDKNSSTFMLKGGHKIQVAHSLLPAIQRKQLERLPIHAYSGVEVEAPEGGDSDSTPPESQGALSALGNGLSQIPGAIANAYDSTVGKADQYVQQNVYQDTPEQIAARDTDQAIQQNLPDSGTPTPAVEPGVGPAVGAASGDQESSPTQASQVPAVSQTVDVPAAYAKGQKGIQEQADFQSQLAKSNAQTEQADVTARQSLVQGFQKNAADFQTEQKKFIDDYTAQKINPNSYVENMGAVEKAKTAIGLFLGGFGSAFTKQGNPALEYLNKQIDRDISAQQSSLDQKKTILGANQELFHDNILAMNQTRVNMNDLYNHQIQLNAAKLGTPQAKAQADMASSKFALENAQLLQQSAIRATALHSIAQGGIGLDPLTLGQAGFIPPDEAKKEQESFDKQKQAITNLKTLYSQADKEQSFLNLANPQSYSRINQINGSIRDAILSTDVNHRISPEVLNKLIDPFLIGTFNDSGTRIQKLQGALNKVKEISAGDTPYTQHYAPGSLPNYDVTPPRQTVSPLREGQTGKSNSGKPIEVRGGKWVYKNAA